MGSQEKIAPAKGISAIVPPDAAVWTRVEEKLRLCTEEFGYCELRLPILEHTELFARSIGEATDIVHKEMFSFETRGNASLSLRPEGTAGAVRSVLEHSLADRRPGRFWYCGPMFRYEKPQKGRARQFHQFGVESLGMASVESEYELLSLCAALWRALGIEDRLELQIASLGSDACRRRYRAELVAFLQQFSDTMSEEQRQRVWQNPLRLLDSKDPKLRKLLRDAPLLKDSMKHESVSRFAALCQLLDDAGVRYTVNPRLVRGLDYYTHTVFEWVAAGDLGGQHTLCAGGRYDGLSQLLGGPELPAAGFALGLERLMLVMQAAETLPKVAPPRFFIASIGPAATRYALGLAEELRDRAPGAGVQVHCGESSLSSQMRQANAAGIPYVLMLGPEELADGVIRLKSMVDGQERQFDRKNTEALLDWVGDRLEETD